MQLIYVRMQHNYYDVQVIYVSMQDYATNLSQKPAFRVGKPIY